MSQLLLFDETVVDREVVHVDASFAPLVPKFLANRVAEAAAMRAALEGGDVQTLVTIAHRMKGVGGTYGFDRVTDLAARLEQAAASGDTGGCDHALRLLQAHLGRVSVVFV